VHYIDSNNAGAREYSISNKIAIITRYRLLTITDYSVQKNPHSSKTKKRKLG
jgi:hypothetical protein